MVFIVLLSLASVLIMRKFSGHARHGFRFPIHPGSCRAHRVFQHRGKDGPHDKYRLRGVPSNKHHHGHVSSSTPLFSTGLDLRNYSLRLCLWWRQHRRQSNSVDILCCCRKHRSVIDRGNKMIV